MQKKTKKRADLKNVATNYVLLHCKTNFKALFSNFLDKLVSLYDLIVFDSFKAIYLNFEFKRIWYDIYGNVFNLLVVDYNSNNFALLILLFKRIKKDTKSEEKN